MSMFSFSRCSAAGRKQSADVSWPVSEATFSCGLKNAAASFIYPRVEQQVPLGPCYCLRLRIWSYRIQTVQLPWCSRWLLWTITSRWRSLARDEGETHTHLLWGQNVTFIRRPPLSCRRDTTHSQRSSWLYLRTTNASHTLPHGSVWADVWGLSSRCQRVSETCWFLRHVSAHSENFTSSTDTCSDTVCAYYLWH